MVTQNFKEGDGEGGWEEGGKYFCRKKNIFGGRGEFTAKREWA